MSQGQGGKTTPPSVFVGIHLDKDSEITGMGVDRPRKDKEGPFATIHLGAAVLYLMDGESISKLILELEQQEVQLGAMNAKADLAEEKAVGALRKQEAAEDEVPF